MPRYDVLREEKEVILEPKGVKCESAIFWLHGRGGSGEASFPLFKQREVFPAHTRIILPTAPEIPITIKDGAPAAAWFDMKSADPNNKLYGYDDAIRSTESLKQRILKEIERHNGDSRRVCVGGFSQGATMGFHLGLGWKDVRLGGVIGVSGFMFKETVVENPDIDILAIHGEEDDVTSLQVVESNFAPFIQRKTFEFVKIPQMKHQMNPLVFNFIKKFAAKIL